MDDKKKIVLATEDVFPKNLEDIYINVNLQRKFNLIKKERFDNNFDLAEQFRRERNASRSFRIYGIIDSTIIDCDNLSIRVWSNINTSGQSPILSGLIYTTTSQSIGFGDKNVFGRMRGKYIIELDNYNISDSVYIEIQGDNSTYARTIVEQTLVFRDADGEFVEYGTETIDVGINGEEVEINNNFPFFYNKHWIKNNFQIREVKRRTVNFEAPSYTIPEGESKTISVRLNEPSVFGNERVTVNLTTPFEETYDFAAPDIDFTIDSPPPFSFPLQLSWSPGQIEKTIDITAILDSSIEKDPETFTLALTNPVNVNIGQDVVNITSTTISIPDRTPKRYVAYNFQKMIKNIYPLTDVSNFSEDLGQLPGFEMNTYGAGLPSDTSGNANNNFRFFPNDNFELTITNEGESTSIPIIPGITNSEQFLAAGDSLTVTVTNNYQDFNNLPREKAVLRFRALNQFDQNVYSNIFFINGIQFGPIPLAADEFVKEVNDSYNEAGVPMPFTITQNGNIVTLTAKHPADNINVYIPSITLPLLGITIYALQDSSENAEYPDGRVTTVSPQLPFVLNLYANFNAATQARYSFSISKIGYKTINIQANSFIAAPNPNQNQVYLVTPINNVKGPSLQPQDPNVCDVTTNDLETTGYFLNGVALLADELLDEDENPIFNNEAATAVNTNSLNSNPSFRVSSLTSGIINCNDVIDIVKTTFTTTGTTGVIIPPSFVTPI